MKNMKQEEISVYNMHFKDYFAILNWKLIISDP